MTINNRANQIKMQKTLNSNLLLQDIDKLIMDYFNNVITPKITINDQIIDVPIMYGSPQKWNQAQSNQIIRDINGKVLSPVIVFKRQNVKRNDNIPLNKIHARNPQLFYNYNQGIDYNRQKYQNNDIDRNKLQSYTQIVIPEFLVLDYSFIVLTDYIQQSNEIIQTISYYANMYWQNNICKFFVNMDDTFNVENNSNIEQRKILTSFNVSLNGFIIPKLMSKQQNIEKVFIPQTVVFTQSQK